MQTTSPKQTRLRKSPQSIPATTTVARLIESGKWRNLDSLTSGSSDYSVSSLLAYLKDHPDAYFFPRIASVSSRTEIVQPMQRLDRGLNYEQVASELRSPTIEPFISYFAKLNAPRGKVNPLQRAVKTSSRWDELRAFVQQYQEFRRAIEGLQGKGLTVRKKKGLLERVNSTAKRVIDIASIDVRDGELVDITVGYKDTLVKGRYFVQVEDKLVAARDLEVLRQALSTEPSLRAITDVQQFEG